MSYDQAIKLFNQEKFKNAIELFEQTLNTNKNSLFYLGICYEKGLGIPKNIWTARDYYELCIKENNDFYFKSTAFFQYINLNFETYKKTIEKINTFFDFFDNDDTNYQVMYLIGYALFYGKFGSKQILYLGKTYLEKAKNYLKKDIKENDLLKLYEFWYSKTNEFFNLITILKKIDFDVIDKYFDIAINNNIADKTFKI
ncbi:1655_t:CDS:1, partial [Cetraspora pellucida]